MESTVPSLILKPIEIRVLGSLIEKSKTTPDYYPMTLNALALACNQKSSRHPIVQYDEATVMDAINTLAKKGLVATATGGGSRTIKYKHNITLVYNLNDAGIAILCLLFLRGPLTPGEINSNSGRLYEFESIEEVLKTLDRLAQDNPPLVALMPRKAGQKEQRYRHLLGEMHETDTTVSETTSSPLEARVEALEKEVAELKSAVGKLLKEWTG